ncbi:MAG: amino acid permease [Candidatus Eisenbacteria bacterium]|nr:amino acid permease [Candidatus Eisenbacteria bacterium]
MEEPRKKMSVLTVSMLIVVTTFGFINVVDNLAAMGLAAIPSWVIVGFLYFLPLALILAEFASDTSKAGGIYSYMERGLGPTWAFVGTWSYFVSNLIYLQSVFSKLPIRISLAVAGSDVFETATALLPVLGLLLCLGCTFLASRGVRTFSRFGDWMGKVTLAQVAVLVLIPLTAVAIGSWKSATEYTASALVPKLNMEYFSTFSWLLFAVSGAEVAAPYVQETRDPHRNFPRAILFSTLWIGGTYILASVAVTFLLPLEELTKATGIYDVWVALGNSLGLPGDAVGRVSMTAIVIGNLAAYVIWMESPLRAMFAEVPAGTFPKRLTRSDASGTPQFALWTQAAVVCTLILIPLLSILAGLQGSEAFISLLNDLASLSLVVPYVFIALSYVQARRNGMDAPFKMVRSTPVAVAIGVVVLVVSAAGYFGAGLYALESDPIDWVYVGIVYGGPILLVLLGVLLRAWSLRAFRRSERSG